MLHTYKDIKGCLGNILQKLALKVFMCLCWSDRKSPRTTELSWDTTTHRSSGENASKAAFNVGFRIFISSRSGLSQAQFSDMKTQQGWKICVIKYKWSKADFDFDFLTVDCQTMYKSQFKQSACRFWRSCSQTPSWSTSCILLYHIGPKKW